jgi:hypothetical protein
MNARSLLFPFAYCAPGHARFLAAAEPGRWSSARYGQLCRFGIFARLQHGVPRHGTQPAGMARYHAAPGPGAEHVRDRKPQRLHWPARFQCESESVPPPENHEEIRAESCKFTNTPHYLQIDGGFGSVSFGQITSAGIGTSVDGSSRQLQLGVRILFRYETMGR